MSEFLASNQNSLVDEEGDSSDWIEVRNVGDEAIDLQGWHLTDDEDNLTRWEFPATSLPAGGHLVVFASGKDRVGTGPSGEHHTNFSLNRGGEFLALVQPDGRSVASSFSPEYPPQFQDISYGVSADRSSTGYFRQPTPGALNSNAPLANPQREILINEIMYHPPSHDVRDEFIEVFNAGSEVVDLSSWQIRGGVNYLFPPVAIQPGEFLVVAADLNQFSVTYPDVSDIVGGWTGQLSNGGESISLVDDLGEVIDRVEYADEGDWAVRQRGPVDFGTRGWTWSDLHDGGGRSLELVATSLPNDSGQNWQASTEDLGTPGATNSVARSSGAPLILEAVHSPIIPNSDEEVIVTARIVDDASTDVSARLWWRVDGTASFNALSMRDDGQGGDNQSGDGVYAARIPAQRDGTVVEFYLEATDNEDMTRRWPAPTANQGQVTNLLYQVDDSFDANAVWVPGSPIEYRQIMTAAERSQFASSDRRSDAQMNATFVSVTGFGVEVRYNAGVRYRGSGSRNGNPPNNRINIPSDRPWHGITALNINWNGVRNQVAGSALFRLAGLPAAEAQAVRMLSNGRDLYNGQLYAHVEPLGSEFASNHFPTDSNGNFYKGRRPDESPPGGRGAGLQYHGPNPGPYVSYTKLTNASQADYADVIDLTARLNLSSDEDYVADVSQLVDVDQWMRFFAMNALLDNSEGGLVNGDPLGDDYALYRGVDEPRFHMIPHDLDSLFSDTRRSIFRARGNPALNRFFAQPEFLQKYFDQLRDLIDNVLLTELASTALDEALRNVVRPAAIEQVKSFLAARSAVVLSQLRDTEPNVTISTGLPTVGEFPRTTVPTVSLAGTAPPRSTQSVLVNGRLATVLRSDGSWSFASEQSTFAETLIRTGSSWRYLDDGSNQGTVWRQASFDDADWASGPAPLGYGDSNEATVVNFVDTRPGGSVTKNATTYFRSNFELDNPHEISQLTIRLRYDDAAAIYINGVEVVRTDNLPANASFDTYATVDTPSENQFFDFQLPASALEALVQGQNTIAVEIHQGSPDSSDIKLDLELVAQRGQSSEDGLALNPGINRILVQAFDGPEGTGEELARQTVDVWYDDATVQTVTGTLSGPTVTWTAAEGPYHVTGDVTVPRNTTLVIQPGTSVYFNQGTSLNVRGVLQAQGTEFERIRFTSVPNAPFVPDRPGGSSGLPAGPPRWNGIHFQDSLSAENAIAHADIEYAQNSRGSIGIHRSAAIIDDVSFRGTHLRMIYADSSAFVIRNSFFPDMFAANEEPQSLGLDNGSEHITSVGAVPNGGQMLIENNFFGSNKGHNDVIDVVSGRRPGPILQVLNNAFTGSGDELLDLGGDAYVAGNVFAHVFKPARTSDRGYSNAISTGDAGLDATVVVARNVFWNIDHAINLKNKNATIFENNTVVQVHDDFVDGGGALNVGSALNFFVDEPGAVAGTGAYAADNIFWNVPRVFGNADLPAGTETSLELHNNLLDPALTSPTIGSRAETLSELGTANFFGRPGFQDVDGGEFSLRPDSPARGGGSFGQDLGALIRPGIWITGEPPVQTGSRSARLTVGGPGIFAFMFRVNGGPWSDEFEIGNGFAPGRETDRTAEIQLDDLVDGTYTVEVSGRDFAGQWQSEPTASRTWTVDSSTSRLLINEVLAKNFTVNEHFGAYPDLIELHNAGGTTVDLLGYSITDDLGNPTKYRFSTNTAISPGDYLVLSADDNVSSPGIHLGFALREGGEGIYLFDEQGLLVDSVEFGPQVRDFSIGRIGSDGGWRLTVPTFGMPNVSQPVGVSSALQMNEWLASENSLFDDDFIELFNPEPLPVELSGLFLSDEPAGNPRQHQMAPLSFIGAQGYLELIADGNQDAGADHLNFRLSSDQEVLGLLRDDGTLLDQVLYFSQTSDVSQGRRADGMAGYAFFDVPTPGAANLQEQRQAHAVVISELHYHPRQLPGDLLTEEELEFVELRNQSGQPVDISHWRLHEAVDYRFGDGFQIPAEGAIVVVGFDPVGESAKATAFREHYEISAQVVLVGPYDGQLSNQGETVELSRPNSGLGLLPNQYESVDRVRYRDALPWPVQADGTGASLSRIDTQIIGSLPSNWSASTPTPGDGGSAALGDVDTDGDIDSADIDALYVAIRAGAVDAIFDLNKNGTVESSDVTFLVEEILQTEFGDTNLDGVVSFADFLNLSSHFGSLDAGWGQGDFDGDGKVLFADFLQLSLHFGAA